MSRVQLGVIMGALLLSGMRAGSLIGASVVFYPSPPRIGQPLLVLATGLPPVISAQATIGSATYRTQLLPNGKVAFFVPSAPSPNANQGLMGTLAYRLSSGDRKEMPLSLSSPVSGNLNTLAKNGTLDQLMDRLLQFERDRTHLLTLRSSQKPRKSPSPLDRQLDTTKQSIATTWEVLTTAILVLNQPTTVTDTSSPLTQASFDAREFAYQQRVSRLEALVAERGNHDPDVLAEIKALEIEDAALTQMEGALNKSKQVLTPPSSSPSMPNTLQGTPSLGEKKATPPPLSWDTLQAERQSITSSLALLIEKITSALEKRPTLTDHQGDYDKESQALRLVMQQRQKEYNAIEADVLQTQQEIKIKHIERQELQLQLDHSLNLLSQTTQTTGPEYQRRLFDQQSLQKSIQNKETLVHTLGNLLGMKERRLSESKMALDRASEAVASRDKAIGFDRRTLWQFDTALSKKVGDLISYQSWAKGYEARLKKVNQTQPNPSAFALEWSELASGNRQIEAVLKLVAQVSLTVPPPSQPKPRPDKTHWLQQSYWAMGARCGYQWLSDPTYTDGPVCGAHVWGDGGNGWAFRAGMSWVSAMKQYRSKSVWQTQWHLMPRLLTALDGAVYGILGGRWDEVSAGLSPEYGVGVQWVFSPNVMGSVDVVGGKEWGISLSVNRRLGEFSPPEEAMPRLESSLSPHLSLGVEGVKRIFRFKTVSLDGLKGHWAQSDIERMVKLGLLDDTQAPILPNRLLTFLEAARMIAFAKNAPVLLASEPLRIWFTISNTEGVPVLVGLEALGPDGKTVGTLIERQVYPEGQHMLSWDTPVLLPDMTVPLSLSVVLSLWDQGGNALAQEQLEIPVMVYDSLGKVEAALARKSDTMQTQRRLFSEWQAMGNASTSLTSAQNLKNRPKATKINPNGELSRLSFVMAVSNVIKSIRGLKTVTTSDLSPYRDVDSFPKDAMNSLYLYTTELEYGGDTNGNLRPFSNITLAEASRIVSRLLDWQEKRTGILIPR